MAHSLEVRSPFLDTDLSEFALRLPPRFHTRGMSLKLVLKAAVRGLVPDEIIDRPKHGFGLPLDRWFRTDLEPWMRSMLLEEARIDDLLRPSAVRALVDEHTSGTANHGHAIWTLLTLEEWLRQDSTA